ncbi:hypothetical protein [Leptospira andrefontaineae]|uniref:DUF1554 domain-containing protein n=1 Tax=Leptospira andrefontaineae TaxID=2484976 RepID=A0A4R9HCQ1_9LEPT|nr:hypothetical protein [Leptospira andrefontaineae]TGK44510.1 hypothetical protein EHO65_00280 [Leptospira andrefontaineae]
MNGKTCSSEDKSCSFNEILYSYISVPPGIYMYSTQASYQGNLAAYGPNLQLSLMNICAEARLFAQTISNCGNTLPFTSSDSSSLNTYVTDFSLDGTLPIRGARGELIFNTYNSLFASVPNLSMSQAGVTTEEFWTFSTGGSYSTSNCTNGVNFDNGDTGNIGDPNDTNLSWFSFGNRTCDQFKKVLCICY